MSRPVKFSWPVADTDAVCLSQPMAGAGALVINGALASAEGTQNRVATFEGLERTVSITSAGNISAVSFTITGTLRDVTVSETRLGPNATTVYTTQRFTTITSVTVDGVLAANASVGSGDTGSTIWYLSDYHRANSSLLVAVYVVAGVISYTFETTPDDVTDPEVDPVLWKGIDGVTTETIPTNVPMINCVTDSMGHYTFPTRASRVLVNSSDATTALEITMIAQGIL